MSAAQRSALARRPRAYQLQAERHCASLLAGESSMEPSRLLHARLGSRRPATTTLGQSTPPYGVSPRCRLSTFGRLRAFSVAGPTSWNSLPDRLRYPTLSSDSFRKLFERWIIWELLNTLSAVEVLCHVNSRSTLTMRLLHCSRTAKFDDCVSLINCTDTDDLYQQYLATVGAADGFSIFCDDGYLIPGLLL